MKRLKERVTREDINKILIKALSINQNLIHVISDDLNFNYKFLSESTGVVNEIYTCNNPYLAKHLKTINEVTVMKFMKENNICPVPQIYDFDAFGATIGYEYILMEKINGTTLAAFYNDLSFQEKKYWLLEVKNVLERINNLNIEVTEVTEIVVNSNNIENTTGENIDLNYKTVTNSGADNNKWFGGCFHKLKMIDKLNNKVQATIGPHIEIKTGPFQMPELYLKSQFEFWHPKLKETQQGRFKHLLPLLTEYIKKNLTINDTINNTITDSRNNNVRAVLCHTDLNPGNIIVDRENKKIVGIIDWEFATLSVLEEALKLLLVNSWCNDKETTEHFPLLFEQSDLISDNNITN
ncbi:hypothetical protein ABK040_010128 [Willaertia magna]